jgi:hypothetical protein
MRTYIASFAILLITVPAVHAASGELFMVKATTQSPEETVKAIKNYAETMKWQYLGENKVKKGEVTLVKICIPEVGRMIWPVGLRLSALLPCGNIGVYKTEKGTEISVLHPRYLNLLHPNPKLEQAGKLGAELLTKMLDAVGSRGSATR